METLQLSPQDIVNTIESLRKANEELRDWESVQVTWTIENFESKLADRHTLQSKCVNVAGYLMCLELQVSARDTGGADRNVSLYMNHRGGLEFFPLTIGGSEISICGKRGHSDCKVIFDQNSCIEKSKMGLGRKNAMSLKDIRSKYILNGEVEVRGTIRVRRLSSVNLRCMG